jgi:hypothetical protein
MPKTIVHETITTETTHLIALNGEDILQALRYKGLIPGNIPFRDLEVFFEVPGGGDWSNAHIDIDGENPLMVRWKFREVSNAGRSA